MLTAQDVSMLGRPLTLFAVIVALGIVAVVYSDRAVKTATEEVGAMRKQYNEAQERVVRSGDEYQTIVALVPTYRELERRGLIGDEQRLSWVDALRSANAQARLYGIDFEVGPQQPYAYANQLGIGSISVQQSLMKVRLDLLYEDDLLGFLRRLAAQEVGFFAVNYCNLQRSGPEQFEPVNQPLLKAECELAWITIAPPVPSEGS